jgi:hypothetical protein
MLDLSAQKVNPHPHTQRSRLETHIQRKIIALQKQFEINIIAQCRVICNLLDTLVERQPTALDKGLLEAIEGALLWYRGHNHAWIVAA